jgi:hypothetical protein
MFPPDKDYQPGNLLDLWSLKGGCRIFRGGASIT